MRFKIHIDDRIKRGSITKIDEELVSFNARIEKDCKQYIRQIRGMMPLYRGMKTGDVYIGIKQTRQDRIPLGMSPKTAIAFNYWLDYHGYIRRDKAIIATSSESYAGRFGTACYIFPIGKYSYTWIKAKDVNHIDTSTGWRGNSGLKWYFHKFKAKDVKDWEKIGRQNTEYMGFELDSNVEMKDFFTTNKGWITAYTNVYEIWLDAKSYYFANANRYEWSYSDGLVKRDL